MLTEPNFCTLLKGEERAQLQSEMRAVMSCHYLGVPRGMGVTALPRVELEF